MYKMYNVQCIQCILYIGKIYVYNAMYTIHRGFIHRGFQFFNKAFRVYPKHFTCEAYLHLHLSFFIIIIITIES